MTEGIIDQIEKNFPDFHQLLVYMLVSQYVHLSPTREVAFEVGRRKSRQPTLLIVAAGEAAAAGIHFYRGNELIWLAEAVPLAFIRSE